MLEDDVTLWNSSGSGSTEITPDSSDLVDGIFTFTESQNGPYYLDAKSYNIHGAIAECMEQLAMDPNKAKQWGRGSIKYTHYDLMEVAKYHRSLAGMRSTAIVRTYGE